MAPKTFFLERKAQSRVKHELLRRYAQKWSGIILNGLASTFDQATGRRIAVHLVYVDGFAGAGRYTKDADKPPASAEDEPIWGSPIIALREIETQAARFALSLDVRVSAVLVEEDRECFEELCANLQQAELVTPIEVVDSFTGISTGNIVVVNADFRDVVARLIGSADTDAFMLAFVDPFGPAMDLMSMTSLISRPRTDVITLFPYADLAVRGGSSLKPQEDWEANDRANITRYNQHFGTDRWQNIYPDASLGRDGREQAFVNLYIEQLSQADRKVVIKRVGLRSSAASADQTAYYLCMITKDANGAIVFNSLIRDTAENEQLEIWRDRNAWLRQREASEGQGSLFGGMDGVDVAPTVSRIEAELSDVKAALLELCGDGKARRYKDVLYRMAQHIYTESEIQKALRALKKDRQAVFEGSKFRKDTPITLTR